MQKNYVLIFILNLSCYFSFAHAQTSPQAQEQKCNNIFEFIKNNAKLEMILEGGISFAEESDYLKANCSDKYSFKHSKPLSSGTNYSGSWSELRAGAASKLIAPADCILVNAQFGQVKRGVERVEPKATTFDKYNDMSPYKVNTYELTGTFSLLCKRPSLN